MSPELTDLVPVALRRAWSRAGYYPDRDIFGLFTDLVRADPDRPAVFDSSGVHNRGELHNAALRLAHGLRERGIGPGSVVCCQLPNSWRSVVVDLAVAALGGVVLPFPIGRGDHDVRALLRKSRASVAVASRHYADSMSPRSTRAYDRRSLTLRTSWSTARRHRAPPLWTTY
ncbi:MAG: AMP-binding protein [Pseudonocardiaceae bacterium]